MPKKGRLSNEEKTYIESNAYSSPKQLAEDLDRPISSILKYVNGFRQSAPVPINNTEQTVSKPKTTRKIGTGEQQFLDVGGFERDAELDRLMTEGLTLSKKGVAPKHKMVNSMCRKCGKTEQVESAIVFNAGDGSRHTCNFCSVK